MPLLRLVTDEEELVSLREKMEQYLPYSTAIHGLLEVMLKTNVRDGIITKLFIPEEPESSSLVIGTPSCTKEVMQSMYVFWDTEKEDDEVILRLLKSLPQWNWSAPVFFRVTSTSVSNRIQEYVRKEMFGKMWFHKVIEGHLYYLEKSDIDFNLEEGFSMTSVVPIDMQTIMPWRSIWTETPEDYISLMTHLPSVAIHDDAHQRLVSWNFLYKHGFVGSTFTLPGYRRRGFASAVTLAMARKMRQFGLPVRLVVEAWNEASKKFHESLGFKRQCDLKSFALLPEGTTMETWIKKRLRESEVITAKRI